MKTCFAAKSALFIPKESGDCVFSCRAFSCREQVMPLSILVQSAVRLSFRSATLSCKWYIPSHACCRCSACGGDARMARCAYRCPGGLWSPPQRPPHCTSGLMTGYGRPSARVVMHPPSTYSGRELSTLQFSGFSARQ